MATIEPTQLNLANYDLFIFDLDGTLVRPRIGNAKRPEFRAHAHDWRVIDEVVPVLHYLREQHKELAIATNQGGVAYGFLHPLDIKRAIDDAAYFLGIYLVYICFDHPEGSKSRWKHDSAQRKPAPGMLHRAMEDAHAMAARTLFVGDMSSDELAADRAGCDFMPSKAFFGTVSHIMLNAAVEDFPF